MRWKMNPGTSEPSIKTLPSLAFSLSPPSESAILKLQEAVADERLLRYYVKLSSTRFIEQWVTPKLYNELLLEIFSSCVTPLNGDKDRFNFQCVYCGGEWSSKL
jgi:hypothetical protein